MCVYNHINTPQSSLLRCYHGAGAVYTCNERHTHLKTRRKLSCTNFDSVELCIVICVVVLSSLSVRIDAIQ